MPTHTLGRKYDLIDVGRAERHHVRADRHSESTVSTPQCSCKQAIQHVPTASTPPRSRSWASCRSPRARSSSPPGPRAGRHAHAQAHRQGHLRKVQGDFQESSQARRKVRGADGKVRRGLREVFEGSECTLPHQPTSKRSDMKLNINWKELAKQLLKAIGPVIAGTLTDTTVVTATGNTSMATQP